MSYHKMESDIKKILDKSIEKFIKTCSKKFKVEIKQKRPYKQNELICEKFNDNQVIYEDLIIDKKTLVVVGKLQEEKILDLTYEDCVKCKELGLFYVF